MCMYICMGECSVCVHGCVCTWMGVHEGKGGVLFCFLFQWYHEQKQFGEERIYLSRGSISGLHSGKSGQTLKAGPWRWKRKHRLWNSTVYWPVFLLLAQTASLHNWGPLTQWWHCPQWAGPFCDQLAIKKMSYRHAPQANLMKAIPQLRSSLLGDSSLCKPNQSKHIGCPFPSLSTLFLGGRVSPWTWSLCVFA